MVMQLQERGKTLIVEVDHPTEVIMNKEVPWHVVGHVEDAPVVNPGVAYYYEEGPADSIILVMRDGSKAELPKGRAYSMYYEGEKPACTNIDSRGLARGAIFPTPGTYSVWLVAGRWSEHIIYYTDVRKYSVAVEEVKPAIPWWIPATLVASAVAIGGIVAIRR